MCDLGVGRRKFRKTGKAMAPYGSPSCPWRPWPVDVLGECRVTNVRALYGKMELFAADNSEP